MDDSILHICKQPSQPCYNPYGEIHKLQISNSGISQIILKRFHYAMIENVLTFSITVWFGRASYEEKAQLETLVKCTSKIMY